MRTSHVAPATTPAAEIFRLIDGVITSGRVPREADISALAKELARMFSVSTDEVALLSLTQNDSVLAFMHPFKLKDAGSIPLTNGNSLATRTVRERRPEMINNFPAQKHPTIFESIPLDAMKADRHPIQKIMSAPLLIENKVVGVVQICRKGKSPTTAGADFTMRDLTLLVTTAGFIARIMVK